MKLALTEKQLQQQVRYFGYYQLVSGALMLALILYTTSGVGRQPVAQLLCFGAACLAGFIVYCGYLTLKQPRRGLLWSRYHLAAQFIGLPLAGSPLSFLPVHS